MKPYRFEFDGVVRGGWRWYASDTRAGLVALRMARRYGAKLRNRYGDGLVMVWRYGADGAGVISATSPAFPALTVDFDAVGYRLGRGV